ncbi:glutathione S-transferase family protein [Jannaschia seohaensis]|uniref:Glutathione S-transferase n=1 Tax=Jannaschia seohaensis TaxID=475081 RepID=A0A2Y9B270_9RHOB|nr:glutathione S-transferase family protein [Jannaschia seohaensis]PWJ15889.1 glutathione S-transferase [Jannaschia seohaensis]SSA49598.1 glutathione S-transferase [Jannaschia seohaensis]
MLTLFHAPRSRATTILVLIEEMGIGDRIELVEVLVRRADGSGGPDPRNPHPEGKVPYLTDGADHLRERGAIVVYLTDLFPEAGLGRPVGHPQRGAFLSWLFYYQGVMEPVLVLEGAGLRHPLLEATFRDLQAVIATLETALEQGAFLLGDAYSAADLLLSSPFQWIPDALSDSPRLRDWIARCADRPAMRAVLAREQA